MIYLSDLLVYNNKAIKQHIKKTMTKFANGFQSCKDFCIHIKVGDERYELEYCHDAQLCYIWGNAINERCDAQDILLDIMNNKVAEELLMHILIQKEILCYTKIK